MRSSQPSTARTAASQAIDPVIILEERAEAKQEFEVAKKEGKTASLLDEERPNVFTMSVANVMPKDRVEVELRYTELLVPTNQASVAQTTQTSRQTSAIEEKHRSGSRMGRQRKRAREPRRDPELRSAGKLGSSHAVQDQSGHRPG